MSKPLILVTNDDGIDSPGLAALASALDPLGELLIVAPAEQQSNLGRSRSQTGGYDGCIARAQVVHDRRSWAAFSVNSTPALAVEYGIHELADRQPDLVVSGISYGENLGPVVTASGTVGAALEAAEQGIRALAISLEISSDDYFRLDRQIDFGTAAFFGKLFARRTLRQAWPPDVDVLKIEVPRLATRETSWVVTRQDRAPYYRAVTDLRADP
jgi:5'-nucleotidase